MIWVTDYLDMVPTLGGYDYGYIISTQNNQVEARVLLAAALTSRISQSVQGKASG